MSVDVIGDFLTIIRNGVMALKRSVSSPYSRLKHQIAQVLENEGFVKKVTVETDEDGHKNIVIFLKYVDGESVIHEITRVSTPGRRNYTSFDTVSPVIGGLGVSILTTSKGLLSNKQAKDMRVGGEVICTVW